MNSGRMTFRFDEETDGQRTGTADRRRGPGPGTALKAIDKVPRAEAAPAPQPREAEYILDLERVELPWSAEVAYMRTSPSREQEWEDTADDREHEPEWYGQFNADGNSYAGSGYTAHGSSSYGGSYHTRRPSYWWKFALSIAGALGTGILLGYAALSFFNGGTADRGSGSTPMTVQPGTVQSGNAAGGGAVAGSPGLPQAGTGEAAAVQLQVEIAPQSYYLLQYGVFSTPAGAVQAQQELLAAGLAAGLDPADGNRVYAGMSPDREQAKLLSSGLKNQGIELYVREVALPAVNQVSYSGTAEAVEGYFAVSSQLLSELSSLSASRLSGAGSGSGSLNVSDLHMQWTEALRLLAPGLPPEAQGIAEGLEKSMSRGISALDEYGKNQAEGLLWEVQEAMLGFLTGQRSLLSAMS